MSKQAKASADLSPGDKVQWQSAQGTVVGKVKKKLTSATDIQQHHVAATPEHPQYLVVSDKTGASAAHKATALHKKSGG